MVYANDTNITKDFPQLQRVKLDDSAFNDTQLVAFESKNVYRMKRRPSSV